MVDANKMAFENLKMFFRILSINYNKDDLTELQFFLVNRKVLILDNYNDVQKAKVFVHVPDLILLIQSIMKELKIYKEDESSAVI